MWKEEVKICKFERAKQKIFEKFNQSWRTLKCVDFKKSRKYFMGGDHLLFFPKKIVFLQKNNLKQRLSKANFDAFTFKYCRLKKKQLFQQLINQKS